MTDDGDLEDIRQRKAEQLRKEATDDGPGTAADAPDEPVAIDGGDDLTDLASSHDVVLADFYADWCGPCKMMEPVVERLAAETDAAVAKVDVDANQPLAAEYGVRGVPTFVLFADGEPVEQLVGGQDESRFRELIERYA